MSRLLSDDQLVSVCGADDFPANVCSGGGPCALAAAHYLPDRVRGVLLVSPASDYGELAFPVSLARRSEVIGMKVASCSSACCVIVADRVRDVGGSPPDSVSSEANASRVGRAGLLTPEQQKEWNDFHGATWLSKTVRAAVRFAPWTLKALARVSETRSGGRALYHGIFKGLISKPFLKRSPAAGHACIKKEVCPASTITPLLPVNLLAQHSGLQ